MGPSEESISGWETDQRWWYRATSSHLIFSSTLLLLVGVISCSNGGQGWGQN